MGNAPPLRLTLNGARWGNVCFVFVMLAAGSFQAALINKPFERSAEGCGAFFGLLARNYFRYDLSATRAIPVMSMSRGSPPVFYANHPPVTPLLVAAAMKVACYRGSYQQLPPTWTIRLPTALATLGCVALLYVMVRSRAGPRAGVLAAALFAFVPMSLLYGRFPDVINPQLLVGILLTLAAYERFADFPTWKNCAVQCLAFAAAGLVDWPAFYVLPVLALHTIFTQPVRRWPPFIVFGLFGTGLFLGLYAYLTWAQPDWRWMIVQILHRSVGGQGDFTGSYDARKWFRQALWEYGVGRHTLMVCLLALLWLALAIRRRFAAACDRLTALLLAWGTLHVLIGLQGVFQHEWWWWPLTPGLIVAAALASEVILKTIENVWSNRAASAVAAVALVLFCLRNMSAVAHEISLPSVIEPGPLNYSLVELGQTVRENVPADSIFMITENDMSLAGWYYLDRAPKRSIWDVKTFEARLHDPWVDLSFDLYNRWPGPMARVVVPRAYFKYVSELLGYLDARYARNDLPKFAIYDLTRPKPAPATAP